MGDSQQPETGGGGGGGRKRHRPHRNRHGKGGQTGAATVTAEAGQPTTSREPASMSLLAALSKAQGKPAPTAPAVVEQQPQASSSHAKQSSKTGNKKNPVSQQQQRQQQNQQNQQKTSVGARIQMAQTGGGGQAQGAGKRQRHNSSSQQQTTKTFTNRQFQQYFQQQQQNRGHHYPPVLANNAPVKITMPEDVIDELLFRFLLNIPEEVRRDEVRVCFQMELAHWFYIDFFCRQQEREDCKELAMRDFTRQMFSRCEYFSHLTHRSEQVLDAWKEYKSSVPTYGAALLDPSLNYVLLVRGYGHKSSWGFPKGKVNEREDPRECAVREVLEETGFDFSTLPRSANEYRMQKMFNDTFIRLYAIPDVPVDFQFAPRTRFEIGQIRWFPVLSLPCSRDDVIEVDGKQLTGNRFFTVVPFVNDLRNYVKREQARRAQLQQQMHQFGILGAAAPQQQKVHLRGGEKTSAFTPVQPKGNVLSQLFGAPLPQANTGLTGTDFVKMLQGATPLALPLPTAAAAAPPPISARPVYEAPTLPPPAARANRTMSESGTSVSESTAGKAAGVGTGVSKWGGGGGATATTADAIEMELTRLLFEGAEEADVAGPSTSGQNEVPLHDLFSSLGVGSSGASILPAVAAPQILSPPGGTAIGQTRSKPIVQPQQSLESPLGVSPRRQQLVVLTGVAGTALHPSHSVQNSPRQLPYPTGHVHQPAGHAHTGVVQPCMAWMQPFKLDVASILGPLKIG